MSIQIALVGYGYWGPNLLRNFSDTPDCDVLYCCDKDITRLKQVRKKFPSVITTTNYEEILNDKDVSAIVIATPTKFHFELAKMALAAGKDVLIEKPMTLNFKEANILLSIAAEKKRIIMVDHTFIYNEAVIKIKEIIESGEIGKILCIDSTRQNLGLFQDDSNVMYDLAPHDLSIIQFLLGKKPKSVQAFGKSHYNKQEDIAHMIIDYPDNITGYIHSSWLSPLKVRTMTIIGTKKMIVYDDVNPSERVKIYDKGVKLDKIEGNETEKTKLKVSYRSGDIWTPNISGTEALSNMAKAFIASVVSRKESLSSGNLGAEVVNILEKATKSIKTGEKIIF